MKLSTRFWISVATLAYILSWVDVYLHGFIQRSESFIAELSGTIIGCGSFALFMVFWMALGEAIPMFNKWINKKKWTTANR